MCVCVCVCVWVSECVRVCVCVQTENNIFTYTNGKSHTHTHTYIYIGGQKSTYEYKVKGDLIISNIKNKLEFFVEAAKVMNESILFTIHFSFQLQEYFTFRAPAL